MKKIFTISFLAISSLVLSQNSKKFNVGDTIYYDKNERISKDKSSKTLAIIRTKEGAFHNPKYNIDMYKLDTVTDTFYRFSNYDTEMLETRSRDGKYIGYWKNGNKSAEGLMYKSRRKGVWLSWYKDGAKQSERKYFVPKKALGKVKPSQLMNFWDTSGKQTVTNGTGYYSYVSPSGYEQKGNMVNFMKEGEWIGFRKSGKVYYKELYKKGKLKKGESWDSKGKRYTYKKAFVQTTYSRGMKGISNTFAKNFKVPQYAIDNGIEGSMLVTFTVDRKGNVINSKVVRKLCEPCDQEALRLVSLLKKWKPAKNKGQPVNVRYTLPLRIDL